MPNVEHKQLILMNGDHYIGVIAGSGLRSYSLVDNEQMSFMDRWVKGVDNGIEHELPVIVYWEVTEPDGDPKKSAAGWLQDTKLGQIRSSSVVPIMSRPTRGFRLISLEPVRTRALALSCHEAISTDRMNVAAMAALSVSADAQGPSTI
ncbi:hypothetical protein NKI86_31580 [Mesorhizobium sp. M0320]|uniref:hypothetical protein n=1 Tax=Mesorhizobium sp. M0320 TaxID=2956936 RepID=UPI0033390EF7